MIARFRRHEPKLRYLLAAGMTAIGVLHFVTPEPFMRIVPPSFGDARFLVLLSGVFEILGGLGLILPLTRRFAAWGLVALFVAVFPANVYMAVEGIQIDPAQPMPTWVPWLRLPFQAVFIAWAVLIATMRGEEDAAPDAGEPDGAAG